jgi:hypothetical protein
MSFKPLGAKNKRQGDPENTKKNLVHILQVDIQFLFVKRGCRGDWWRITEISYR